MYTELFVNITVSTPVTDKYVLEVHTSYNNLIIQVKRMKKKPHRNVRLDGYRHTSKRPNPIS